MPAITTTMQRITLTLLALLSTQPHETSATPRPSSTHYAKASFIPPASPSIIGWPSTATSSPQQRILHRIATGYGTYDSTARHARPQKKAASSSSAASSSKIKPVAKNGKIQIVLLKSVKDLGQSGDVVFVSSAVFQNTLKRNGLARLISEEEVAKLEAERVESEKEWMEHALRTKRMMEEACGSEGGGKGRLRIERKAGPEGNLFARVNAKAIVEALEEEFPQGAWDGKGVKLLKVRDSEGVEVKKMDIKTVGEYSVDLTLGKGVDVTFLMEIVAE